MPIFLDNDMNASALAEVFYGAENKNKALVYVGFSSGVGAGIVTNGRLLHGSAGFAGEIGHISINSNGPLCGCGQRGCVELYTSISNLLAATGTESVKELATLIKKKEIPRYVQAGIQECRNAIKTLLITIANMYDPECIVLGEIPDEISQIYLSGMEEYMNEHMFHHGFQKIEIQLSYLKEQAAYLGAVSLVFQKIFAGEIVLPGEEKENTD